MKSVRIGLIGVGYWGAKLLREYSSLSAVDKRVRLQGIADTSQERLDNLRGQPNQKDLRLLSDYKELLEDSGIDAVHIATPNQSHFEVARVALENGKHVLLEKPMATSSRDALKLARLSEESGLVLQVGHIFRFNNALQRVRQLIQQGNLGPTFYANLRWTALMAPRNEADIIFDLAPHPVDILNYLLDEWPTVVSAAGGSYLRKRPNAEEMALVILKFPNGIQSSIHVSWLENGPRERTVRLVCQRATLECDVLGQSVTLFSGQTVERLANIIPNNTIRDMQIHFVDTIIHRGGSSNSALIGATTVRILEAIAHSSRQGSSVSIAFA